MSQNPSEPIPEPSAEPSPAEQAAVPTSPPGPARARLPWLVAAMAGTVAIAAVAALVVVLVGRAGQPQYRYQVRVYLRTDVTADQKAKVKAALPALHPVDAVQFETREQAWQKFQKEFKGIDSDTVKNASVDAMPESFIFTMAAPWIDCRRIMPVRQLPGVETVQIFQLAAGPRPAVGIDCGA